MQKSPFTIKKKIYFNCCLCVRWKITIWLWTICLGKKSNENEKLFGSIHDDDRAVAEHLSKDVRYQISADDVYLTVGCTQAIEVVVSVLARPGANILLPRPGYPQYEARAGCSNLEARHFDLLPEKGWEVDLDSVEALADENTVAMVIINPSNPCGNVFTAQHLKKVYLIYICIVNFEDSWSCSFWLKRFQLLCFLST